MMSDSEPAPNDSSRKSSASVGASPAPTKLLNVVGSSGEPVRDSSASRRDLMASLQEVSGNTAQSGRASGRKSSPPAASERNSQRVTAPATKGVRYPPTGRFQTEPDSTSRKGNAAAGIAILFVLCGISVMMFTGSPEPVQSERAAAIEPIKQTPEPVPETAAVTGEPPSEPLPIPEPEIDLPVVAPGPPLNRVGMPQPQPVEGMPKPNAEVVNAIRGALDRAIPASDDELPPFEAEIARASNDPVQVESALFALFPEFIGEREYAMAGRSLSSLNVDFVRRAELLLPRASVPLRGSLLTLIRMAGDARALKWLSPLLVDKQGTISLEVCGIAAEILKRHPAAISDFAKQFDPKAGVALNRAVLYALASTETAEAVDPIIGQLSSENAEVRCAAIYALDTLGLRGKPIPDALRALVSTEDTDVRMMAIRSLGSLRDLASVPALISALSVENANLSQAANESLAKITGTDLPPEKETWENWWTLEGNTLEETLNRLSAQIDSAKPMERAEALKRLSMYGHFLTGPLHDSVREKLKDPSPEVRIAACHLLASARPPQADEDIMALEFDPDPAVSEEAYNVLISLGLIDPGKNPEE